MLQSVACGVFYLILRNEGYSSKKCASSRHNHLSTDNRDGQNPKTREQYNTWTPNKEPGYEKDNPRHLRKCKFLESLYWSWYRTHPAQMETPARDRSWAPASPSVYSSSWVIHRRWKSTGYKKLRSGNNEHYAQLIRRKKTEGRDTPVNTAYREGRWR